MEDYKKNKVALTIEQNYGSDGKRDGDIRVTGPLKDVKLCMYLINEAVSIIQRLNEGKLKAISIPNPGDLIYRKLNQYGTENVVTKKST